MTGKCVDNADLLLTDSSFAVGKMYLWISSLPITGTIFFTFEKLFDASVGQIASHFTRVPEIQVARDLRGETGQGLAKRASISALAIIIFTRACSRVQWLGKKKNECVCVCDGPIRTIYSRVIMSHERGFALISLFSCSTRKWKSVFDALARNIELNRLWIWNLRIASHTNTLRDVISFEDTLTSHRWTPIRGSRIFKQGNEINFTTSLL